MRVQRTVMETELIRGACLVRERRRVNQHQSKLQKHLRHRHMEVRQRHLAAAVNQSVVASPSIKRRLTRMPHPATESRRMRTAKVLSTQKPSSTGLTLVRTSCPVSQAAVHSACCVDSYACDSRIYQVNISEGRYHEQVRSDLYSRSTSVAPAK